MKRIGKLSILIVALVLTVTACRTHGSTDRDTNETAQALKKTARFDSDSAYSYVARQVAMGPRVSGTHANAQCAEYIVSELTRFGADSIRQQRGKVTAYNGDVLPINNIMGAFNPSAKKRILLLAHYDTRPWADSDLNAENHQLPIPGANDGASGVGVLLEIARQLSIANPPVGVDFLFVDAEDYGQSGGFSNHDESWALGSQFWAKNMPYAQDSLPAYAILLDMVGGIDAKFHREYFSQKDAPHIVDKVWSIANRSGYGDRFVNIDGGAVVDDHVPVNKAGIPAIDIIESKNSVTKTFSPTWHTMDDDMDNIDRATLKAVGQTVMNVIFNEKP